MGDALFNSPEIYYFYFHLPSLYGCLICYFNALFSIIQVGFFPQVTFHFAHSNNHLVLIHNSQSTPSSLSRGNHSTISVDVKPCRPALSNVMLCNCSYIFTIISTNIWKNLRQYFDSSLGYCSILKNMIK